MTATLLSVPPRFRSVPLHVSSAGQDCIDLAEGAGLVLDDWQAEVLRDALGVDSSGKWAAMEVALIVPRQNGKGGILEALELFHLFLVRSTTLITHTAHRFDTCLDHFRRIRKLIEDTPALLELVKDNGRGIGGVPSGIKDSNGKESIELRNGDKLNFKAREKGSGRGFSGDLVVLDEAFWLRDLSGLIPTMAARENPQAWYTSSAPLPREESDQLRALIRDGRALAEDVEYRRPEPDDPTMTYLEWSIDAPAGADLSRLLDELLDDDDRIAEGNPAYGIRINRRFCKMERKRLGDAACARERFGIFPEADDAPKWLVASESDWTACGTKEEGEAAQEPGWLVGPVTLAIESPPGLPTPRTSIEVAGDCREGGIGVDVAVTRPGSEWVVAQIVALKADETRNIGRVVIDPRSPAGSLIADLQAAGVEVTECSTSELTKATRAMVDEIADHKIVHRNHPDLTRAVSLAVKRKSGESFVIDRWADQDACEFIGATLARMGHLLGYETKKPRSGVVV